MGLFRPSSLGFSFFLKSSNSNWGGKNALVQTNLLCCRAHEQLNLVVTLLERQNE